MRGNIQLGEPTLKHNSI